METSIIIQTLLQNSGKKNKNIWSLCFSLSSFTQGLVADGGSELTLDVLLLAVDDEEQRGVHSYTPEVKRLPEGEDKPKSDQLERLMRGDYCIC